MRFMQVGETAIWIVHGQRRLRPFDVKCGLRLDELPFSENFIKQLGEKLPNCRWFLTDLGVLCINNVISTQDACATITDCWTLYELMARTVTGEAL